MRPRTAFLLVILAAPVVGAGSKLRAQEAAPPSLPLRDVALFSSGVGYFQREGRIQGRTTVPLSFRSEQVNDILKSLVLLDPAGQVKPVTYSLQDGGGSRLSHIGENLDPSTSLGVLLRQFQGARMRLELATGGEAVEGRLLSISVRNVPVKIGPEASIVAQEWANVLTDGGLRAISLDSVVQVRLLDEKLDRELREGLERRARGLDDQRQSVTVEFGGGEVRTVKAGYLQEMPVWKTSYRLVLEPGKKPYLQGWSIVENPTDEDWKDVRLSLISGRPISFLQDLYQPLYVPRPVVQAQVIGSPNPQTYGEVMDEFQRKLADAPPEFNAPAGPRGPQGPQGPRGVTGPAGPPGVSPAELGELRRQSIEKSVARIPRITGAVNIGFRADVEGAVASQAEGTERGALFEYAIKDTVSIPKGQAAMVPIVTAPIAGEPVSIYDPASDQKRVLNGFRLKNDTGLHLSGGPITVFRDGGYAGDAQITNLQPEETRLLSYAVDLDVTADFKDRKSRQETLDVVAENGVLLITHKSQLTQTYSFHNKSKTPKSLLVLQRQDDGFKLVEPAEPFEKTQEELRFKVDVPAGKTTELKVVTERPISEKVALLDLDLNVLTSWSLNGRVSEKLRGALKQLIALRGKTTELQRKRGELEGELKAIDTEQARIRQNMMQLDRNSALYQQYVKKLTEQEGRIEQIRTEIQRLKEAENATQKELRDFVSGLTEK
jgi:hypothetical protein